MPRFPIFLSSIEHDVNKRCMYDGHNTWIKLVILEHWRQAGTSIVRSSTVTRHAAPMGQCTGPHLSVGSIYYNAEVYPYSVWRAPPERGGLPSVQ